MLVTASTKDGLAARDFASVAKPARLLVKER
jgi:hypothetical protein